MSAKTILHAGSPVIRSAALALALAAALLAGTTACGGKPEPKAVPDVRGLRLDVAERELEARGLRHETLGGGTLGIIVRSNWIVCDQRPRPGAPAVSVMLIVDRECPEPPFAPDGPFAFSPPRDEGGRDDRSA